MFIKFALRHYTELLALVFNLFYTKSVILKPNVILCSYYFSFFFIGQTSGQCKVAEIVALFSWPFAFYFTRICF